MIAADLERELEAIGEELGTVAVLVVELRATAREIRARLELVAERSDRLDERDPVTAELARELYP